MAVGVGFEPTVRMDAQRFSRPPRSTTPAPHPENQTRVYLQARDEFANTQFTFSI